MMQKYNVVNAFFKSDRIEVWFNKTVPKWTMVLYYINVNNNWVLDPVPRKIVNTHFKPTLTDQEVTMVQLGNLDVLLRTIHE